jgi:hypothetical protein
LTPAIVVLLIAVAINVLAATGPTARIIALVLGVPFALWLTVTMVIDLFGNMPRELSTSTPFRPYTLLMGGSLVLRGISVALIVAILRTGTGTGDSDTPYTKPDLTRFTAEFPGLIRRLREAPAQTLHLTYRPEDYEGELAQLTLSLEEGGFFMRLELPSDAFVTETGDPSLGGERPVVLMRDHDIDGTMDDFRVPGLTPTGGVSGLSDDGFLRYVGSQEQQVFGFMWDHGIAFAVATDTARMVVSDSSSSRVPVPGTPDGEITLSPESMHPRLKDRSGVSIE